MMTRALERAKPAAALMLGWVALLWVLEMADAASGNALDTFGVQPREMSELADVLPAAFIHFGFDHLAANTLPLLLLASSPRCAAVSPGSPVSPCSSR